MYEALLIIFLIVTIALIALIMLQNGKGTDMGLSFGTGASGTLFSSSSSATLITHTTAILAMLFFIISLVLSNIKSNKTSKVNKYENLNAPVNIEYTQSTSPVKLNNDIPK